MSISVHHRIRVLLEETSDAFDTYGVINADFADFAALAISDFKDLLGRPALTRTQLQIMLRLAMNECRDKAQGSSTWAAFVAHHLAQTANRNQRGDGASAGKAWPIQ